MTRPVQYSEPESARAALLREIFRPGGPGTARLQSDHCFTGLVRVGMWYIRYGPKKLIFAVVEL
eukprot:766965-Hanusia_phi.AAC.7